jgi:pimeloyl-ACP methyl ester carboxylesterase
MAYLSLKETTVYYEVEGDGYPLIFIHGMGLSHLNWRPQVDFFKEKGFKTITFDVRGHGKTAETLPPFKKKNVISQITNDIHQILQHLEIDEGIFLGYSTGTIIAQNFALTFPHMTKGLVLSGAFPKVSNMYLYGKIASSIGLTFLNARSILANSVARSNGKDKNQIEIFRKEAKKVKRKEAIRILKASLAFDCLKQLKEIKVPILVTYGGNETHMMKYRSQYLDYAPTAEVCLLPNVSHATLTKCTEGYNSVLHDFVKNITSYFFSPSKINPTPKAINNSLE